MAKKKAPAKKEEAPFALIEQAKAVEAKYLAMAAETNDINEAIAKVYNAHGRRLEQLAKEYHFERAVLEGLIFTHTGAFEKPRTMTVGLVKFGIHKQKGKTVLPKDRDKMYASLMEIVGEDQFAEFVKVEYEPIIAEILKLSGENLKALGVKIIEDTDEPVVSIVQGGAEQMAEAILRALSATEKKK